MAFDLSVHARRRAAVAAEMRRRGGGALLLPAAVERARNADNEYPFRQDSDFLWLTGLEEPEGCALLLAGDAPGAERLVLFVRPRDREKEIWNGYRTGVEGARETYGATEAYPVGEQAERLAGLLDGAPTLWFRLGQDAGWDGQVGRLLRELRGKVRLGARAPAAVADVGPLLHELRLVKGPEELALLRKAAELTAEAHLAAMRDGLPGRREFQVQAEIEYAFRRRGGSGPGYGTIVAPGARACVLHYRAGDGLLQDGELCLVDAGGEYRGYTADVTRVFPVSGSFTRPQRALYEVVLAAEEAAIAAVRPGATLDGIHAIAVRRLTEGLVALGLLPGPVDARIAEGDAVQKLKAGSPEEKAAPRGYRKYYMHRTSHWLGLDVHDVGDYFVEGASRPLAPGMVLTVEPGLYVAADDEAAPAEYRGIGIRIEDDILVTADGHENLTAAVPKAVAEVEACCTR